MQNLPATQMLDSGITTTAATLTGNSGPGATTVTLVYQDGNFVLFQPVPQVRKKYCAARNVQSYLLFNFADFGMKFEKIRLQKP